LGCCRMIFLGLYFIIKYRPSVLEWAENFLFLYKRQVDPVLI
jgi:hypothetical protein